MSLGTGDLWASVDIGSSSVRLLIARASGAELLDEDFAIEVTRLASGLKDGVLDEDSIARTVQAASGFVERARAQGVPDNRILPFATAAVRTARNGAVFVRNMRDLCGLSPRVLAGNEEAACSLLGARRAFMGAGRLGVLDIGGASTEYALSDSPSAPPRSRSVALGALTLCRAFPEMDIIPAAALEQARDGALSVFSEGHPPHTPLWLGVSSTVTLAAAVMHGLPSDAPEHVHGCVMSLASLEDLLFRLAAMPLAQRRALPGMPAGRADTLPFGLAILTAFLRFAGTDSVTACTRGNLHGIIYASLENIGRAPEG